MNKNEAEEGKSVSIQNHNHKEKKYLNDNISSNSQNESSSIEVLKQKALSSMVNLSQYLLQNEIETVNKNEMLRTMQFSQCSNTQSLNQIKESSDNNTKCSQCHMTPIIGDLFKCSQCLDYTLCSKCEEANYQSQEHPHNFIRLRRISNFPLKSQSNFSVKLLNGLLEYTFFRNVDDYCFELRLLNDGDRKWPRPTILVSDNNYSSIEITPEVIKPIIDKGDECSINIRIANSSLGIHKLRLLLLHETTEETIGQPIDITVKVIDLQSINKGIVRNHSDMIYIYDNDNSLYPEK